MSSPTPQRVLGAYQRSFRLYVELLDRMDETDPEVPFVRHHLSGVEGRVLDLGCGPGQWSAFLHSLGLDVLGVDLVPEFIAHARWAHPGPEFLRGSMTELDLPPASGILAWFSTIHLPPDELASALERIHELLELDGRVVIGFFDSDHGVAEFEHKVTTAWRWPADTFAERMAEAGLEEVDRLQWTLPDRPDRRYAAIAARAVRPQE